MTTTTLVSIREAARIIGVSHTAVRLSLEEGRPCRGADLVPYAVYNRNGDIKGILRASWSGDECAVQDSPLKLETHSVGPDSVDHSKRWPWSSCLEDVVAGRPIFGAVYQRESQKHATMIGYAHPHLGYNLKTLLLSKFKHAMGRFDMEVVLLTLDHDGIPKMISLVARIGHQTIGLNPSETDFAFEDVEFYG